MAVVVVSLSATITVVVVVVVVVVAHSTPLLLVSLRCPGSSLGARRSAPGARRDERELPGRYPLALTRPTSAMEGHEEVHTVGQQQQQQHGGGYGFIGFKVRAIHLFQRRRVLAHSRAAPSRTLARLTDGADPTHCDTRTQLDGKLMGHVVPGLLLFGLSLLWFIELVRRRLASRSAAGARRAGRGGPPARPALHVPRASFTTLECLGKLLFPAIGIGTEIRSAARKQLPTGILPAFSDHAGRVLCEAGGDRECREYTTTLQHWFHITIHLGFMCAAMVEMLEARRAPGRPAAAEVAAGARAASKVARTRACT